MSYCSFRVSVSDCSFCKVYDPKQWTHNRTYGIDQLTELFGHFKEPLSAANYDHESALKEWKSFRAFANANYRSMAVNDLWEKVFQYKKREYPNLCIISELVMCLSGSNSTVERAFNLITLIMSDRRLSLSHSTMEDIVTININDKLWIQSEREEIIRAAANKYEKAKRRVRKFNEPPTKRPKVAEVVIESSSEDSDEEEDEDRELLSDSDSTSFSE